MDIEWCKLAGKAEGLFLLATTRHAWLKSRVADSRDAYADTGLPKPDAVIFLSLPIEVAAQRGDFGNVHPSAPHQPRPQGTPL
jgi:hypothetical protein